MRSTELVSAVRSHRLGDVDGGGRRRQDPAGDRRSPPHLADEFPDGVWVFELAAVVDPAAVPDAVAAVLGITQQPGMTVSESVAAALDGRVRLLVFDNCEHVVDAAADLVDTIRREGDNGTAPGHQPRGTRSRRRAACGGCPSLEVGAAGGVVRGARSENLTG